MWTRSKSLLHSWGRPQPIGTPRTTARPPGLGPMYETPMVGRSGGSSRDSRAHQEMRASEPPVASKSFEPHLLGMSASLVLTPTRRRQKGRRQRAGEVLATRQSSKSRGGVDKPRREQLLYFGAPRRADGRSRLMPRTPKPTYSTGRGVTERAGATHTTYTVRTRLELRERRARPGSPRNL